MERQAVKALIENAYEARRMEDIEGLMGVFHLNGKFVLATRRNTVLPRVQRRVIKNFEQRLQG